MGSICLSSASILRCTSLTSTQSIILIIPTALEVIFSTLLIFVNWGKGRRHLLITAEGCVYATLALVDLLSHILPAAQKDMDIVRALDRAVGVASFLPIFFYTFFLYLFTQAELLETLPSRLKKFATLFLILSIPVIVSINEVSSFVGIAYSMTPTPIDSINLNIGFTDSRGETLWTFFTSLTLALLTGYQASVFFFVRLIHAVVNKRRIETSSMDAAHLLGGIGWLSAALKLGAIETVVGFAGGQFGVALTRKMLRFLSRAFLCIGLAKGVDSMVDFRAVQFEIRPTVGHKKEFRRSRLRQFISNPRLSTFRQLSPTATAFHSAPRGANNFSRLPDTKPERVTIQYANGTPMLQVRFSGLNLPSLFADKSKSSFSSTLSQPQPALIYPFAYSARNSHVAMSSISSDPGSLSSFYAGRAEIITAPQRTLSQKSARALIYQATGNSTAKSEGKNTAHMSTTLSVKSVPESIVAVRELTPQFPGPPSFSQQQQQQPFPTINTTKGKGRPSTMMVVTPDLIWEGTSIPSSGPPPFSQDQQQQHFPTIQGKGRPSTMMVVAPDPIWEESSTPSSRTSSIFIPRAVRRDDVDSSPDERYQRLSFVRDTKFSRVGTQAFGRATPKFIGASEAQGLRSTPPFVLDPIDPFQDDQEKQHYHQDQFQDADVFANPASFAPVRPGGRFTKHPSHMPSVPSSPETNAHFGLIRQSLHTGSSSTLSTRDAPLDRGSMLRTSGVYGTPERGSVLLPPPADSDRTTEWAEPSSSRSSPGLKKPTIPWIRRTSRLPAASPLVEDAEQNPTRSLHSRTISWPKPLEPTQRADSNSMDLKTPPKPRPQVKSLSSAPKRSTPSPTHSKIRGSLHIEPIMIPPPVNVNRTEVTQGSLNSAGTSWGVLRDSEVLEIEDKSRRISKRGNYF